MADIRPTPDFPGLHIVGPTSEGPCSATAVCRCSASRTGTGLVDALQVIDEYLRHRDACTGRTAAPASE